MPLQRLSLEDQSGGVALWKITENESTLASMVPEEVCPCGFLHAKKRKEWWAVRVLIKGLLQRLNLSYGGVGYDVFGRPFLQSHAHVVSISHAFPYAVVCVRSAGHAVGVDIERPRTTLLHVASRVLSVQEMENACADVVKLCVYWCAKEALYKIYGKGGLSFKDQFRVAPFELAGEGSVVGSIVDTVGGELYVRLHYRVDNGFVLVCSEAF